MLAKSTAGLPKSAAVKRIMTEFKEQTKTPSPYFIAGPLDNNIYEWHFTLRGPTDSEFQGGKYHGKILLPTDYPFSPPDIIFLTPNGRFEVGQKICLSITRYHAETWQPSLSIRKMLESIGAFMVTPPEGAVGGIEVSPDIRKRLAVQSKEWKCPTCGISNDELLPNEKDEEMPPPPPPVSPVISRNAASHPSTPLSTPSTSTQADSIRSNKSHTLSQTPLQRPNLSNTPMATTPLTLPQPTTPSQKHSVTLSSPLLPPLASPSTSPLISPPNQHIYPQDIGLDPPNTDVYESMSAHIEPLGSDTSINDHVDESRIHMTNHDNTPSSGTRMANPSTPEILMPMSTTTTTKQDEISGIYTSQVQSPWSKQVTDDSHNGSDDFHWRNDNDNRDDIHISSQTDHLELFTDALRHYQHSQDGNGTTKSTLTESLLNRQYFFSCPQPPIGHIHRPNPEKKEFSIYSTGFLRSSATSRLDTAFVSKPMTMAARFVTPNNICIGIDELVQFTMIEAVKDPQCPHDRKETLNMLINPSMIELYDKMMATLTTDDGGPESLFQSVTEYIYGIQIPCSLGFRNHFLQHFDDALITAFNTHRAQFDLAAVAYDDKIQQRRATAPHQLDPDLYKDLRYDTIEVLNRVITMEYPDLANRMSPLDVTDKNIVSFIEFDKQSGDPSPYTVWKHLRNFFFFIIVFICGVFPLLFLIEGVSIILNAVFGDDYSFF